MILLLTLFAAFLCPDFCHATTDTNTKPTVNTTSGQLIGVVDHEVIFFKGIRYGQPPTGLLRWKAPEPFVSRNITDASKLGASCLQQFYQPTRPIMDPLYNTPPAAEESEDCLFLNVWAPARKSDKKRAVIFWMHGGAFAFGSASLALYDGASFAKNQDVIFVSINYRLSVFGFPSSDDPNEIEPQSHNLGLLDQELALEWTRLNVAAFGGDPLQITIMGHSAGATSVAWMLNRHAVSPPFRSAILISSPFLAEAVPKPDGAAWNALATAVGCTGSSGKSRLDCLKNVPASALHDFVNGPSGPTNVVAVIDNFTVFGDPIDRIHRGSTARLPLLQGTVEDEGTLFTLGVTDADAFINATFGGLITIAEIASVYPNVTGPALATQFVRDFVFVCPTALHTEAYLAAGVSDVFRYTYGPIFEDLELLPELKSWHGSELRIIFGTFNATTATPAEKELSCTMQTILANFAKDPHTPPAPAWPRFQPSNDLPTLAKLAYSGNVGLESVVQVIPSGQFDFACTAAWDAVLAAFGG